MQQVSQALDEVRDLYLKVLGTPAPEIDPNAYMAFPPGVDPLSHAIEEVNRLKQISEQVSLAPGPVSWVPRADCYTTPDAYIVRLEIPGVQKDDLKVFLAGGECVISGTRKALEPVAEMRPLAVELPWGPFERRFVLPPGSHPDKVAARYETGLLEVRITLDGVRTAKEMKVEVA